MKHVLIISIFESDPIHFSLKKSIRSLHNAKQKFSNSPSWFSVLQTNERNSTYFWNLKCINLFEPKIWTPSTLNFANWPDFAGQVWNERTLTRSCFGSPCCFELRCFVAKRNGFCTWTADNLRIFLRSIVFVWESKDFRAEIRTKRLLIGLC